MSMKALSKIGLGAAALLLCAVAVQPAWAACAAPYAIIQEDWIVTNPDWPVGYYYIYGSPAVSPDITGNFWALTGGDPVIGAGNDNGALSFNFAVVPAFAAYEGYNDAHFPWQMNGGNPLSWQPADVDGCIDVTGSVPTGPDLQQCTCLLITDNWNGEGYYVINSTFVAADLATYRMTSGDNELAMPGASGDLILSPVPKPQIVGSSGDASGKILNVMASGAAIDNVDPCGCMQGYKVYGVVQPIGAMAPARDVANWTELQSAGGTAQTSTPLGMPTSVRVDCGAGQQAYIVTVLTFDSGYRGRFVSSDATRVNCDQTLADPSRPTRPGKPIGTDPGRPERGKGAARGR